MQENSFSCSYSKKALKKGRAGGKAYVARLSYYEQEHKDNETLSHCDFILDKIGMRSELGQICWYVCQN